MDFLDKVKNVATDLYHRGGTKSKEVYAVTKLKLEISNKQGEIKNLYRETGFAAYKAYRAKSDLTEAIKDNLLKIDSLEDEIALLRKKIEDVKDNEEIESFDAQPDDEDKMQKEYDEAEKEPVDGE